MKRFFTWFINKLNFVKKSISRSFILSSKPELVLFGLSWITLFFIFLTARFISNVYGEEASQNYIVESVKILGGAIFAGIVALLVTNVWQQKSIGFEMLKELNSPEFFKIRNYLSAQKKIAVTEGIDLDDIKHWFPSRNLPGGFSKEIRFYDETQFSYAHALPSMVYFIVRLANYARHGMLNVRVTKNLFNVFFVHYQILLLEFADVFETYYNNVYLVNNSGNYFADIEIENGMWLTRADDIRYFFCVIGLLDKLPDNHPYEFFPSMNGPLDESKSNRFVTEIDLSDYIKSYQNKSVDSFSNDSTVNTL